MTTTSSGQPEREHLERLELAVEACGLGIWELDLISHSVWRTLRHDQIFGYPALLPEWTYEMFLEHVLPEDRPEVERRFQWAVAHRQDWEFECRIRRADGEVRWIAVQSRALRYEAGEPVRMIGVVEDITERKSAEEALRETRDYLENLLDYANAPIIVWDPDFKITRFNHAFEHLTGRDAKEVVGRRLDLLFPEDSKEKSLSYIYSATAGQRWESVEIPILRKAGDVRTVLWNSATLYTPDQKSVVATIAQGQDITERKRAEAERDRLLQAERQARKDAEAALRTRDEFLGVAAHELKTPITNLRGYAELTLKRMDTGRITDPQEVRRAFETIDRQADRLAILTNQLLDLSGLETGELTLRRRETDVVALVRGLVDTMRAASTRHTLTLDAPTSLTANVDAERLRLILYNLIDNAIKYSPQGGPVEADVSAPDAQTVRIAVRDYGVGIAPEQRPQLFTRFFKAGAKRPAGGLGLGLYIGQRLVALHGGRIWAEFPEDGGSRFVVEVPGGRRRT